MKLALCVSLSAIFAAAEKPSCPDPIPSNVAFRLVAANCAVLKLDHRTMPLFAEYDSQKLSSDDYPLVESLVKEQVATYNAAQMRNCLNDKKSDPTVDSLSYFIQLPRYRIQLVGLRSKDGTPLIYVNCVGRHYEGMWQTRFIEMMDGGNSYFQLLIDLKRRKCIRFDVNGEA